MDPGGKPMHQPDMEQILAQPRSNILNFLIIKVSNHLPVLGFVFLTFSIVSSIYHSRPDPGMLAFVISSYVNLLLLFWCLDRFDKLGQNSPPEKRERLKVAIWVLATVLSLSLAWRVSEVMPWVLAVVIWSMAAFVVVAGFYGFFIYEDQTADLPK